MSTELPWGTRLGALSVAAAGTVSVIYLPQPLLAEIANSLRVDQGDVGMVATAVQCGYALGIFLLVPLADRFPPRRQITAQLLVLVVALLVTAVLPTVATVATGFLVVGLVANVPQLIIPVAGRLAPPGQAAATTATLVAGVFAGIFGGRVLAGLLGGSLGWRWTTVVFAVLVAGTIPLCRSVLPDDVALPDPTSYLHLLGSTARRLVTSPTVRRSGVMQMFAFAAFNAVWTVVVLHLRATPSSLSSTAAGLFGLVGLAAGLLGPLSDRLAARVSGTTMMGASLTVMLLGVASIVLDREHFWPFAVSVFALTAANQALQAANQNRAMRADGGSAAQANTVFMACVFVGGSLGAALGSLGFAHGGMKTVALVGIGLLAVSGLTWARVARSDRTRARTTA